MRPFYLTLSVPSSRALCDCFRHYKPTEELSAERIVVDAPPER